jgi:hypothetical protein
VLYLTEVRLYTEKTAHKSSLSSESGIEVGSGAADFAVADGKK